MKKPLETLMGVWPFAGDLLVVLPIVMYITCITYVNIYLYVTPNLILECMCI